MTWLRGPRLRLLTDLISLSTPALVFLMIVSYVAWASWWT